MNDTQKSVLATVLILGIVFSVVAAIAYTVWHGSITWQIPQQETKTFDIYDVASSGTPLNDNYEVPLGLVQIGHVEVKTFYIQNTGTVQITVTVTFEAENGCIGSWSEDGVYTIPVSSRVPATLTLTITGEGSYGFDFGVQ